MENETISVFDIFKIGIGPSSSHTLGPWKAALRLLGSLQQKNALLNVNEIKILLYGSLAKTGIGHGTDVALQLGLSGFDPVIFEVNKIESVIDEIAVDKKLKINGIREITFDPISDIVFLDEETLPFHSNALSFLVSLENGELFSETYYSVGGGFVLKEGDVQSHNRTLFLFTINTSEDLLSVCLKTGLSIHQVVMKNELVLSKKEKIETGLLDIWQAMLESIYRGCHKQGILPGGLDVKRRAGQLNKHLLKDQYYKSYASWIRSIKNGGNTFSYILDWVNCFALAVNEENASFGRVVTAPTNGAAGVIPSVLQYFIIFCDGGKSDKIVNFLLTASAIGIIFKKGATISAAMGGCQAEIGVSSAMAAAALTESLGGTVQQALMAAEIAMEHHLGLTCDPVGGLVQIPCIERNTMGAIKAITAAQLALQSNPNEAKVTLDTVVKTMWDTAIDMKEKYKETAEGGLAVNIPLSLNDC